MHARRELSRRGARLQVRATRTDFVLMAPLLLLAASTVVELAMIGLARASLHHAAQRTAAAIDHAGPDCAHPQDIAHAVCERASFLPYCAARLSASRIVFPAHPTAPPSAAERAVAALLLSDEKSGDLVLVELGYDWRLFSPVAAALWGPSHASTQLDERFAYRSGERVELCDQAAEAGAAGAVSSARFAAPLR